MGKLKALIPIALALVIAVVGSVYIYDWMQQQAAPERTAEAVQVERPETVQIAVAAMDVAAGTRLSSEMIKTQEYLKKGLLSGHFTDADSLKGRIALAPLRMNEPITEHRLAPIDVRTGGVAALISEGKRAVSLGGDKVIGISGFIHPGNRVDVMVTWQDPDSEEQITKRILENVLVLATGTQMQETERGTTAPVDVYTLEVTPEESEILTHIRNQGRIQLALRSPIDSEPVLTAGATSRVSMQHLEGLAGLNHQVAENKNDQNIEPVPVPVPVAKAPNPPGIIVEVIQGGKLNEFEFKR